jgi:DNA-binding NarL/FixJ family response regulator
VRAEPVPGLAHAHRAVAVVAGDAVGARRLFGELQSAGFVAVGRFTSVADLALERTARAPDAVVLVCPNLDASGAAEVHALRQALPYAGVVVVVPDASRRAVHAALEAGADGFVVESRVCGSLGTAVAAVCAGHVVLPREWRDRVARAILSPREKQVLGMVVMSFTNQEVATKLGVAESTVKSHLTSIYAKLGVRGRNEATAVVLDPENGLGTGVLAILDHRSER